MEIGIYRMYSLYTDLLIMLLQYKRKMYHIALVLFSNLWQATLATRALFCAPLN